MTTINALLHQATAQFTSVSDTAALDAEVLLCRVLNKDRSYLRAWPEQPLTAQQQKCFQSLLNKRCLGTPIAYITGHKEFWSRKFLINENVLIPRPDTELIIERAINLIPENQSLNLLDLGTGSGNIAITLAKERPAIAMVASDTSAAALAIARENARRHKTHNLHFYQSHWFENIPQQQFDLILSNPPYIAANDPHLQQGDLRFEPQTALIAAQQGLQDISEIVQHARCYMKSGSHLLIEHGYNQKSQVQAFFKQYNYAKIITHNDWAGQPRVTAAVWDSD